MPLFQLCVSYRATATVQVEANDEDEARQIWLDSDILLDPDEVDEERVLSAQEVAPDARDPSMTTITAHDLSAS